MAQSKHKVELTKVFTEAGMNFNVIRQPSKVVVENYEKDGEVTFWFNLEGELSRITTRNKKQSSESAANVSNDTKEG